MHPHPLRTGLALAVLGAFGFSAKAIVAKLAYRHGVDAITVVFLRMALALPLFLAMAFWAGRGQPALTRAQWWPIFGLGFCGYYLASTLDFLGLQYISASLERLILYLNPSFVLLLGFLIWRQRPSLGQLAAVALGYAGIALAFGRELNLAGLGLRAKAALPAPAGAAAQAGSAAAEVLLGMALVAGSAISYALYLVYSARHVKALGSVRLTGWATSVACVLCIVQFFVLRKPAQAWVSSEVFALSLFNAVFCTALPIWMTMAAVKRIGAAMAAQASMAGPLMTLGLAALLLGEPLDLWVGVSTALVLASVVLTSRAATQPGGQNAPQRPSP